MAKIDKQSAAEQIREAQTYTHLTEYHMQQLPSTPGRATVERGLEQVRQGIREIKREAEID